MISLFPKGMPEGTGTSCELKVATEWVCAVSISKTASPFSAHLPASASVPVVAFTWGAFSYPLTCSFPISKPSSSLKAQLIYLEAS